MVGFAASKAVIMALTSSSLYAACFIQIVLRVTWPPPPELVVLLPPEQADNATTMAARRGQSGRIRLGPRRASVISVLLSTEPRARLGHTGLPPRRGRRAQRGPPRAAPRRDQDCRARPPGEGRRARQLVAGGRQRGASRPRPRRRSGRR